MGEYITSQRVSIGKLIEPIHRIKLMSPDEWEVLIEEWLETTKKYDSSKIERLGGSGDIGIDVIAFVTNPTENPTNYKWDCYQCKRYDKPLAPSSMWIEFAKIIYYSFIKEYPVPQKYYLIGTNDIGTSLKKYFIDTKKLKDELKKQWKAKCEKEITKTTAVVLEGKFLAYFDKFDFSIFEKINPKIIVEGHKAHSNHLLRFGGGLPSRIAIKIPSIETDEKLRYVEQLVKAYDSDSTSVIEEVEHIEGSKYDRHFKDSRKSFYKAEELRALTRDNLTEDIFEEFKEDVYDGIINKSEEDFENGYKKVKEVESEASKIIIDSNPLTEACRPADKKGACHHLVNDEKISWIEDE